MGTAIGDTLPLAVGVAISPLAIIAMILLLVTPGAVSRAGFLVAGCSDWRRSYRRAAHRGTGGRRLVAGARHLGGHPSARRGLALFGVAVQQWRARSVATASRPRRNGWMRWMRSPRDGRLRSGVFSGVKPKNLLLTVGRHR